MALRGHGSRLVLISPYTSIADLGARTYPYFPVRWLLLDRFDTESKAPRIRLPVLIVHGIEDEIVPVAMGERLARLFPNAQLKLVAGGHHNDLLSTEMDVLTGCIASFAAGSGCRSNFPSISQTTPNN
jgi:uncharacterized protein